MAQHRKERELYQTWGKGNYHFITDGWKEGMLFHTLGQYAYGMILIGLLTLKFGIRILSFSLMSNHIHIVLEGTGRACVEAFNYLRLKISRRLVQDGYPPVPDDYWFKLVPIESDQQLRREIIYVDRNAFEWQICIPSGYPWGSAYLQYSRIGKMIAGIRAGDLSKRKLEELTGSRISIPSHWEFHPTYGLLPSSFVDYSAFYRLFPSAKDYQSSLVKDYETYVTVAKALDEVPTFSEEEATDILRNILHDQYKGRRLKELGNNEKGQIVGILAKTYLMPTTQIARVLKMSEHLIQQFLRSKDYGHFH